ncbi:hypothetical protein J6590_082016, partial [Homalodisca vitripennis]
LSGIFGIYRYCSALSPLFLSASVDHPIKSQAYRVLLRAFTLMLSVYDNLRLPGALDFGVFEYLDANVV